MLQHGLSELPFNTLDYVKRNFQGAEGAHMIADLAGLIDPSPVSDIAGGLIAKW